MSIWSEARGTVKIKPSEHFSLKKYTKELYDEVTFSEVHLNDETRVVNVSVCAYGQQAMDFFTKWVEGIPGKVDMIVELRMIK